MAIKKSELYSSLWKSCDELRGGMDASQYKNYVLVLLFIKYVSDKYAGRADALIEIPEGGGFRDMLALKGKKEIGTADKGINAVIKKLADANDLDGVITVADFSDSSKLGKGDEMQERLSNLVGIFENPSLDFSKNRTEGDDILGDAYEYLMRHFATESGKSKGQFYTPAEVSRVIAKIMGINQAKSQDQTIYDPTCGSGSLLLKAADEAPRGVTIYGQEMDNATAALAKMNMILHNNPSAEIWQDNTLSTPHFKDPESGNLKTFDFVVANPPFSTKSWTNGVNTKDDPYQRFNEGIPPDKNGDYAFMLHIIHSLKNNGKGAVILPHGVLFRGGAEGEIRKNIIKKGYIKGIIALPANLFYGTNIPACIIVLDKENAASRRNIFMIDASKGFVKDGNKNRLRHQDIHKIVDVFTKQIELPKYARSVPLPEIEKNDYNLNIPRYIDSSEVEDIQDIAAHLLGGIPNQDIANLEKYWQVCPMLKSDLFSTSTRAGYSQIKLEPAQIKTAIYTHPEFTAYIQRVKEVFEIWRTRNASILKDMTIGDNPRALIETLSEDMLQAFAAIHLIDPYDVYQYLMNYWVEIMQDDVYLVAASGWQASDDLIPQQLVINRYFADDKQAVEQLEMDKEMQKTIKTRENTLKEKASAKFATLSIDEVKALVVDDKWMATLYDTVKTEMERISQALTERIKQLAERYATPMPELTREVKLLSDKVDTHLAKMGFDQV